MNEKKYPDEAAFGGDADALERLAGGDPRLAGLLARLTPGDVKKLQQVISDPELTKRILATPRAQELMRSIKNGGNPRNNDR